MKQLLKLIEHSGIRYWLLISCLYVCIFFWTRKTSGLFLGYTAFIMQSSEHSWKSDIKQFSSNLVLFVLLPKIKAGIFEENYKQQLYLYLKKNITLWSFILKQLFKKWCLRVKNKFVCIQSRVNVYFREHGNATYIAPEEFNWLYEQLLGCRMESNGSEQGQVVRFVIMVVQIRVSSKVINFWQSFGKTLFWNIPRQVDRTCFIAWRS
jgi:hypothetical protein